MSDHHALSGCKQVIDGTAAALGIAVREFPFQTALKPAVEDEQIGILAELQGFWLDLLRVISQLLLHMMS